MERRYKELCQAYKCDAKVFTKMKSGLKSKIGSPDLLVLFTSTVSHKMVELALRETKGSGTVIARSHTSSIAALRDILEAHTA